MDQTSEHAQEPLAGMTPPLPASASTTDRRRHRSPGKPRAGRTTARRAPEAGPRERLLQAGPEALAAEELLAILLGFANRTGTALAEDVISGAGGLAALRAASYHDLLGTPGVGTSRACAVLAAVEFAKRLGAAARPPRPLICSPADVHALLGDRLRDLDRENFVVLLLDAKNVVIGSPTVAVGTLSQALVHPREVFKPAIRAGAASVVLAHNHPSGDPRASREDRQVTARLTDAASILGIEILDHVIVGEGFFSMKEHGML